MRRMALVGLVLVALVSCGDSRSPGSDAGDDGKNDYFYGDPSNAITRFACVEGETDRSVGARYEVCLPRCTGGECPAPPGGATTTTRCERVGTVDRCFLECATNDDCPSGMSCVPDDFYCAFERIECTEDASVCPEDMPCREAGTTGTFFCLFPR